MKYSFVIFDVFSPTAFGGNQLAVLPEAAGLSPEAMQKIAREFSFAESTFVLPAEAPGGTRRVRIFTPQAELPFAGHPTIGTAAALVHGGHLGPGDRHSLILEEGVGPVAVEVERRGEATYATLTLDNGAERRECALAKAELAAILGLEPPEVHGGFFASVGLPFCYVGLSSRAAVDRAAVDRAAIDRAAWRQHLAEAWSPNLFLFAGEPQDGAELYARMFAPALGVEEDPATGSAAAALVGAIAAGAEFADGVLRLSILQGVAMGRRSEIAASARKAGGKVVSISVGGASAYVASGEIEVPDTFLT